MLLEIALGTQREPAECVIEVGAGRQEISELYPFLTEVTVETSRARAAVATLRFETRRDETGRYSVQDAGVFTTWAPIVITASFGSYTEEVMRGFVREIRADYPGDAGATTVTVQCQDESFGLDREHMRRAWGADSPTTDRAIAEEILGGRHGLGLHPDSADGQSGLVRHQDSTDIQFLRERAQANGYELLFAEGEVYFGPMRLSAEPQATIMVYAGRDTSCINLSIRDDGHQPDRVSFEVMSTDGAETVTREIEPDLDVLGTEPADSSSSGLGDFTWRMSRGAGADEEELAAAAQRRVNEAAMRIRAEGELDGSIYGHVLRVGEPVGVDGVGDRYGGIYYVDEVSHRFDTSGYRQRFKLLRNAHGDNLAGSSSRLSGLL